MKEHGSKMWIVLRGRTAMEWSLRNFAAAGQFDGGVVVVAPEHEERIVPWLQELGLYSWQLTPGGADRYLSVQNGLRTLEKMAGPADIVLIHDAARILVSRPVIDRVREAAAQWGAAVPGIRVTDTVKRVKGNGDHHEILATVPREDLWVAQTPQAFRYALIVTAHDHWAKGVPTDDGEVVESAGAPVVMVAGDAGNRKLTTPDDLPWFEWRLHDGL